MSSNTQAQGRTLQSEAGFTFTPRTGQIGGYGPAVGDDANRSLYRWEAELQRQLKVGDPIYDAAAKQRAMDYGNGPNSVPVATPSAVSGSGGALTKDVALGTPGKLLSTITKGIPASVSATTGILPTGTSLAVSGQTIRLTGTPTGTGSYSFTATVVTDNGNVTFTVAGTVAV